MTILNNGENRGASDVNDMFLRFVSKDGINEFPTIILLTNRLFLMEGERLGSHEKITETIKNNDDFLWYKIKGIDNIKRKIQSVFGDSTIYEGYPFFRKDNEPSHTTISNCWYSKNNHYFDIEGALSVAPLEVDVFNETEKRKEIILYKAEYIPEEPIDPEQQLGPDDIVDIITLNEDCDFILTNEYVYKYNSKDDNNILSPIFKIQKDIYDASEYNFTGICISTEEKEEDDEDDETYLVLSSRTISGDGKAGIYLIKIIDSELENFKKLFYFSRTYAICEISTDSETGGNIYDYNTHTYTNGLMESDNYIYCYDKGDGKVELSDGEKGCIIPCKKWFYEYPDNNWYSLMIYDPENKNETSYDDAPDTTNFLTATSTDSYLSVKHYGDDIVLYRKEEIIVISNGESKTYEVENVYYYYKIYDELNEDYQIILLSKDKDNKNIINFIYKSKYVENVYVLDKNGNKVLNPDKTPMMEERRIMLELNESNFLKEDETIFSITSLYATDKKHIYFFTKNNTTYIQLDKYDIENKIFVFPIAYVYEKDKDREIADIKKIPLSVQDLVEMMYLYRFDETFLTVNEREINFLYAIFEKNDKSVWYAFGDDNRRDTLFKNMASAFDIE
jgi:hypothetical protein